MSANVVIESASDIKTSEILLRRRATLAKNDWPDVGSKICAMPETRSLVDAFYQTPRLSCLALQPICFSTHCTQRLQKRAELLGRVPGSKGVYEAPCS